MHDIMESKCYLLYLVLKLGVYIIKLYLETHQSFHASHK